MNASDFFIIKIPPKPLVWIILIAVVISFIGGGGLLFLLLKKPEDPQWAVIKTFWQPFMDDGAVLVLAVPPLVFTGPDALHEFEALPQYSLEVRPPPRWPTKYDDFLPLRELFQKARSEEEKNRLEKFYEGRPLDKVVPYYVVPNKGYTGLGDAQALGEVMSTLLRINPSLIAGNNPKLRVETDDSVMMKINENEYPNQNLIVLGGERANKVAAYFEKELLDKRFPNQRYYHEYDNPPDGKGPGDFNPTGKTPKRIGTLSEKEDCGYIIRLQPNAPELDIYAHVVIFDGFGTCGTLATAYVTTRTTEKNLTEILQEINKKAKTNKALQIEINVNKMHDETPVVRSIEAVNGTLRSFKPSEVHSNAKDK